MLAELDSQRQPDVTQPDDADSGVLRASQRSISWSEVRHSTCGVGGASERKSHHGKRGAARYRARDAKRHAAADSVGSIASRCELGRPIERSAAALRDFRQHRLVRQISSATAHCTTRFEPAAIDTLLDARPCGLRALLLVVERQAHLPAGHRKIDVGEYLRVEQRPVQVALRIVDAVALGERVETVALPRMHPAREHERVEHAAAVADLVRHAFEPARARG